MNNQIEDEFSVAVGDRYQLGNVLGKGGLGITYRAKDLHTDRWVAIKVVALRQIKNWKVLDLLTRETQILQNLDHPSIPKYIDSFEIESNSSRDFYLVQELAPGLSLTQWVEQGWQPSQADVISIAQQLLEILIYLQSFSPAIIHRDVKPQNILRDRTGNIYLVDFGSIQDTYRHTVAGGSTVVGTFGYMAPEQFRGQAAPATDLFGLGATLIFLLTGAEPSELPEKKLQIDFRAAVSVEPFFGQWLDGLIAPAIENRIPTAQAALEMLRRKRSLPKSTKEAGDRLHIVRDENRLYIEVAPQGFQDRKLRWLAIATFLFAFITSLGITFICGSGSTDFFGKELGWLFISGLASCYVTLWCFNLAFYGTRLLFTANYFALWEDISLLPRHTNFFDGDITDSPLLQSDLSKLEFIRLQRTFISTPQSSVSNISNGTHTIMLIAKGNCYYFGHGLSLQEYHRIIEEIARFMDTATQLSEERKLRILGRTATALDNRNRG